MNLLREIFLLLAREKTLEELAPFLFIAVYAKPMSPNKSYFIAQLAVMQAPGRPDSAATLTPKRESSNGCEMSQWSVTSIIAILQN